MCPSGLRCASPNAMRPLSSTEINLITICKCYSCFPNRPGPDFGGLHLYSHAWTRDKTECWYTRPACWGHGTQHISLQSQCPCTVLRPAFTDRKSEFSHFKDLTWHELMSSSQLTSIPLYPVKSIMYANPPFVNRNSVQCIWDNSEEGVAPIEDLEDKVNGTVNNNKVVGFNEEC